MHLCTIQFAKVSRLASEEVIVQLLKQHFCLCCCVH